MKAFVGGWEQTSTVTVQCLVTPADARLNDTTTDFKIRESILDMLERSNADSSPTAGFNVNHPGWDGGWIHETAFFEWRKANGEIQIDNVVPNFSDACTVNFYVPSPPPPGDSLIANGHSHVTNPGDPMYCRTTKNVNGVDVPGARFPGDTAGPVVFAPPDSVGADRGDRSGANALQSPNYVITNSGLLLRIDPVANNSLPNPQTWYRVFGGTTAQRKCSWPKKYKYQ